MDQPNQPPRRESISSERLITVEQQLNYFRDSVDKQLREICEDVKEIKDQTIKTNGRVNGLESWKDKAIGAWFVIVVLASVVAFFVGKIGVTTVDAKPSPAAASNAAWTVKLDDEGNPELCASATEGHPYCVPLQTSLRLKR